MIETERLLIRPLIGDEVEQLVAAWREPANERLAGAEAASDEQVRAWAAGAWGVWERESGELVGDCTVFFAAEHGAWELAYGIDRGHWGRGYATEAARACVTHAFAELGVVRLVADVDPGNAASVRVLDKLGFRRAGGGAGGKLLYALER